MTHAAVVLVLIPVRVARCLVALIARPAAVADTGTIDLARVLGAGRCACEWYLCCASQQQQQRRDREHPLSGHFCVRPNSQPKMTEFYGVAENQCERKSGNQASRLSLETEWTNGQIRLRRCGRVAP